jgi:LPXTG-motif cell wall-anchored protein
VWEDNSGDVRGLTTCDSATAPAGPELPPTGTDTAPLAAIGLLALLVGVTGVAASRRRATP